MKNIRGKVFRLWLLVTIILTIVWMIVVWTIYDSQCSNEESFLNEELKRFEGEVSSTLITYKMFSNYIFDEINEDQEIMSIMSEANFASDQEKAILREKLYNKVYKKYSSMKRYEYRQLHFHLPNTESFLRVHSPDNYGDILSDVRESVRLANENMVSISGFEEGRIFNGFRYVYPLKHNNKHIGSVEISISSASVIEVLSKLYTDREFYFIIQKDAVEEKVFDKEMINYKDSYILDDYYVDKEVNRITNVYNKIVPDSKEKFFKGLRENNIEKIKGKKSFSTIYKFNGKDYTIKYLSIESIKQDPIAYLISISESIGYEKFSKNMNLQIILVTLLVLFIIIFGLVLAIYHNKIKDISERDYLTNIYNRNKFYEIVNKEASCSRRYKYDSSIMLMDIDNFKNINDSCGHEWGDQVLKSLVSEVSKNIRDTDVFARWGGEEFVLLLPHTKKDDAIKVAEKIRILIDESETEKLKGVTISIGVSEIDSENYDIDSAIKLADQAMYSAKRSGKNKVCFSCSNS